MGSLTLFFDFLLTIPLHFSIRNPKTLKHIEALKPANAEVASLRDLLRVLHPGRERVFSEESTSRPSF